MSVSRNKMLFVLVGLVLLSVSLSQPSWGSSYKIEWDNLNSGIQPVSSDEYFIMASVGGSVIGGMQSAEGADYVLVGGFWTGYYTPGDVTCDGNVDAGDLIYLINYLFIGGAPPCFWNAGDVNCDKAIDMADAIHLVNYLFIGGPPPLMCDS
jgi:hypothetical protein